MTPGEVSAGLRRAAFETEQALEPATTPNGLARSFGLIHEFRQGDVVVTMAAFRTGDLSLYFSSGGGILGGIQHEKVAEMVRKTVPLLAPLAPQLERSDDFKEPAPGEVCFYILTTKGRYCSRLSSMPAHDPANPNFQLFALCQGLIGELRKASTGRGA